MSLLAVLVVCAVTIACSFAEEGYPAEFGHGQFAFHGHYGGTCGNDGFYYKDHFAFVICSNGNAYEQPCAPGSRNSGYDKFHSGGHYYYRDFCDINLVDYGAGIPHSGYGYGDRDGHHGAYGGVAYESHLGY